jgi:hypothetical protein
MLTKAVYGYGSGGQEADLIDNKAKGDYVWADEYRKVFGEADNFREAGYDVQLKYICCDCIEKEKGKVSAVAFLFRLGAKDEYSVCYPLGADADNFRTAYEFLRRCTNKQFRLMRNSDPIFSEFVPEGFSAEDVDNALERVLGVRPLTYIERDKLLDRLLSSKWNIDSKYSEDIKDIVKKTFSTLTEDKYKIYAAHEIKAYLERFFGGLEERAVYLIFEEKKSALKQFFKANPDAQLKTVLSKFYKQKKWNKDFEARNTLSSLIKNENSILKKFLKTPEISEAYDRLMKERIKVNADDMKDEIIQLLEK